MNFCTKTRVLEPSISDDIMVLVCHFDKVSDHDRQADRDIFYSTFTAWHADMH